MVLYGWALTIVKIIKIVCSDYFFCALWSQFHIELQDPFFHPIQKPHEQVDYSWLTKKILYCPSKGGFGSHFDNIG